ncbi:hypothetical protein ACFL0X_02340 [Nanoarchaeota archaeon]
MKRGRLLYINLEIKLPEDSSLTYVNENGVVKNLRRVRKDLYRGRGLRPPRIKRSTIGRLEIIPNSIYIDYFILIEDNGDSINTFVGAHEEVHFTIEVNNGLVEFQNTIEIDKKNIELERILRSRVSSLDPEEVVCNLGGLYALDISGKSFAPVESMFAPEREFREAHQLYFPNSRL